MSYFLVPSSPPATVVAVSVSPSTIQVAWDEVPERDRNGIITMYEIQYWKSGDQAIRNNVTVGTDDLLHELDMLEDFQSYFIRVRAYTVVGAGPYSEPVTAQADQQGNCFTQHCVHRSITIHFSHVFSSSLRSPSECDITNSKLFFYTSHVG